MSKNKLKIAMVIGSMGSVGSSKLARTLINQGRTILFIKDNKEVITTSVDKVSVKPTIHDEVRDMFNGYEMGSIHI